MSDLLAILDRLIGFDTVSARPNRDLMAYVSDFLTTRGARVTAIAGKDPGKSGLVATIGPETAGGIALSAHTDVVPVEGQDWTPPAFALTREGGRLYGRGTTDMKGFVACMLGAADLAAQAPLRAPLTLVLSYDEEIGCVGIQEMRPALPALLGAPRLCIVGEPTEMAVATGHKGKIALRAVCSGEAGHSALAPNFVNALDLAADLVVAIRQLQVSLRQDGARDAAYAIPYSTAHVGLLSGGRALNIVPEHAELTFELRHLAADAPQQLLARIKAAADGITTHYGPAAAIRFETLTAYPGLDLAPDDAAVGLASRFAATGRLTKVAFGTEAGVFQEMGVPTIVCGPGSMSGQGHKPDEYIEISQLAACQAMLGRVVEDLRA
ncbi:acetylornithine deacetylase [Tropicibacter oceani]|uniref:Acetylornithine deacetylase n=1 Tax=Tropicibacter oceani TaxID=3058420 RepID=A0ABY8QMS9_9RHOB|nr:acetylornithine deacetylase [Tropicibacter oceani]WGW05945.1 acetylornithine deacetylase [Tropicibacter oceani]